MVTPFREYPLLNTPSMVLVILRAASGDGPATVAAAAAALAGLLDRAGERPPFGPEEIASRLEMLVRYLAEAKLVSARAGRQLRRHPARPGRARRASAGLRRRRPDGLPGVRPPHPRARAAARPRWTRAPAATTRASTPTGRARGRPTTPTPRTAPTTSPGRTAGPRRSTRTSAGPARGRARTCATSSLKPGQAPPPACPSGSGSQQRRRVALGLAEPDRPGVAVEDRRHPVVHRRDVGVRRAGDEREARHLGAAGRPPEVPDRGEGEDRLGGRADRPAAGGGARRSIRTSR